ncbi:hypothetical protein RF11_02991 [Thelohanellus kitauei]|uniref:Protein UNC80 C-terminal domain-containing protein n=1 Tax=Thelohanellus kitauei TaxID=669202 RepID=A0A0C2MV54_THEKT|nr:hypothetical protein RF11_02991 [Thelohanellus kitauei]
MEFTFHKFFVKHGKYFIFQTYSSVSASLNSEMFSTNVLDCLKIESRTFCELIFSLNKIPEDTLNISSMLINVGEPQPTKPEFSDPEAIDNVEYCIKLPILALSDTPRSFQNLSLLIILCELLSYKTKKMIESRDISEVKRYQIILYKYLKVLMFKFEFINDEFSNPAPSESLTLASKTGECVTSKLADFFVDPIIGTLSGDNDVILQNRFFLPNVLLTLFSKIYSFLTTYTDNLMNLDLNIEIFFRLFLNIFSLASNSLKIAEMPGLIHFIQNIFSCLNFDSSKHQSLLNKIIYSLTVVFKNSIKPNTSHVKSWQILEQLLIKLKSTLLKNQSLILTLNFKEFVQVLIDILCDSPQNLQTSRPYIFNKSIISFLSSFMGRLDSGLNASLLFFNLKANDQAKSSSTYEPFLAFVIIPLLIKLENKTKSNFSDN